MVTLTDVNVYVWVYLLNIQQVKLVNFYERKMSAVAIYLIHFTLVHQLSLIQAETFAKFMTLRHYKCHFDI